jgi:hypothetical protein
MAYNFRWTSDVRKLLDAVFNTSTGHNHDGSNSKAVTTGTPGAGVITKTMFATGALAADATGRAVIADDYFNAATVLLKIADNAFAADTATRALFVDGIWTLAKLAADARTRVFNYEIEACAAGVDIAARPVFECPTGFAVTIVSAKITTAAVSSGVDGSNTSVWAIANGSSSIASATKTADVAAATTYDLGTISGYGVLAAGDKVKLSVTNGTTAATPIMQLQIVYTILGA